MSPTKELRLAHDLRVACLRIARKIRYQATDLSPHLVSVLAAVEKSPQTAGQLAAAEQITPASMSRTISQLLDRDLVSRQHSPDDARQLLISLTDKGKTELTENRRRRDTWMANRIAGCTPAERKVLAEAAVILDRFVSEGSR